MDRVAWPICKTTLKALKPSKLPQNPVSIGEHIKKRRLEQRFSQKGLAQILGVNECTIWHWENNYYQPQTRFLSKIIEFLEYNPIN